MALADELLNEALPGEQVATRRISGRWTTLTEQPWKRWRSGNTTWAVYLVLGNRLPETTVQSLATARDLKLLTVVVASDSDALSAIAPHYPELQCHVLYRIAGRASLIAPGSPLPARRRAQQSPTRIPLALIEELEGQASLRLLRASLARLRRGYSKLLGANDLDDDNEHTLLQRYAASIMRQAGFRATNIDAPSMIRNLESSGWGGRRDHFFHSFQNYFFGLFAISEIPERFNAYSAIAKLHWDIDPFAVWFFTALWHDVGYGLQKIGNILEGIFGADPDVNQGEQARLEYLKTPIIQDALRDISCLMVRLLNPQRARTAWLFPERGRRRTQIERQVEEALRMDVLEESHGAASSLRLYREYMPRIRKMGTENQLVPKQIILLACCSAPFHDWHFRQCVRSLCGACRVTTDSLPFAGLLAFVDSIQDDRRDLTGLRSEVNFLERLIVNAPATVTAQVNRAALNAESVLWKCVEARDVLASLSQNKQTLFFEYPNWMVA
jgi:hypothetical protein